MEEIARWLKQPNNYKRGVALYKQYGSSKALIFMLETGESNFNRKKLIEGLRQVQDDHIPDMPEVDDIPHVPQTSGIRRHPNLPDPPAKKQTTSLANATIERLEGELKLLYKRQSDAHSKLKVYVNTGYDLKERQKACFEILDIGKEIRAIGLVIREIRTNGKVPQHVLLVEQLDPAAQYRKLTNNRSYISKYSEDSDKQDEIDKRTMENLSLERLLKIKKD